METIRECPFCGVKGKLVTLRDHKGGVSRYFINCSNRNCLIYVFTPKVATKQEAIKIWNRRF